MNRSLIMPANLLSAGQLALDLSLPVETALQLATAAGVAPVLTLDGLPYFDAADFDRLVQQLHHDTQKLAIARLN